MLMRRILSFAGVGRRAARELPVDMQLVETAVAEAHRCVTRDRLQRSVRWAVAAAGLLAAGWLDGLAVAHGAVFGIDASVVVLGSAAVLLACTLPPLRAVARMR